MSDLESISLEDAEILAFFDIKIGTEVSYVMVFKGDRLDSSLIYLNRELNIVSLTDCR